MESRTYIATADMIGQRLDRCLAALLPGASLRARRRVVNLGLVLVNGHPASCGRKIQAGDILNINTSYADSAPTLAETPRMLDIQGDYCFFYKPAKLHTVSLANKPGPSLQNLLPAIFTNAGYSCDLARNTRLLQRLDYGTSGIVCAALTSNAELEFREHERNGRCNKYYLALLRGKITKPIEVRYNLDCANRKKTVILKTDAPLTRRTFFEPVEIWDNWKQIPELPDMCDFADTEPSEGFTLAICHIEQGQRHQIRVHASAAGHPLAGDSLYGEYGNGNFFLRHFLLKFPGHIMFFESKWPKPPEKLLKI